jgi:hypothetical protein
METEQLLPATSVEAQELEAIEKSPAFVPEIATLVMVTVEAVGLESVVDCEALEEPMVVDANVSVDGVTEMLAEPAPVPVRATDCGLLPALSVN